MPHHVLGPRQKVCPYRLIVAVALITSAILGEYLARYWYMPKNVCNLSDIGWSWHLGNGLYFVTGWFVPFGGIGFSKEYNFSCLVLDFVKVYA